MNIYSPTLIDLNFTTNISTVTSSYTIQSTDKYKLLLCSGSETTNITITGSFDIGTTIPILRYAPAAVNINTGSGVTIRTSYGNSILSQYGIANLFLIRTNEWLLYGDV